MVSLSWESRGEAPANVDRNVGVIRVYRARLPRRDIRRRYRVHIDGKRAGELMRGQERAFETAPGEHIVQMRMGRWLRSPRQALVLQPGDVLDFECRPRESLVARIAAVLVRRWYLILDGPLHDD